MAATSPVVPEAARGQGGQRVRQRVARHPPERERQAAEERQRLPRGVARHRAGRIGAADDPGGQAEPLEIVEVALDLRAQPAHTERLAGLEPAMRAGRGLDPGDPIHARHRGAPRRGVLFGLGATDRFQALGEAEGLAILGLDDQRPQRLRHAARQLADRSLGLRRGQGPAVVDTNRLAHEHERPPAPERPGLVEDEPDREQRRRRHVRGSLRPQHDAGDPRPERHQRGLGLAHALRKDQDRLAVPERGRRGGERGDVLRGVAAGILTPMDRQRARQVEERRQDRMTEERRLRHGPERARQGREEEERIDERVPVIRDDDQRAVPRHAVQSDYLDPVIEDAHQRPRDQAQQGGPNSRARARRVDQTSLSD